MEEVKHEEEKLNIDKQKFLLEYKNMKLAHPMSATEMKNAEQNQEVLNKLFNQGIIDEAGNVLVQRKQKDQPMK